MNTDKYNDIRPYNDAEVEAAIGRVVINPLLEELSEYFFDGDREELSRILLNVKSVESFQRDVMAKIIIKIIEKSTTGLTYTGLENIGKSVKHLIISNHRDIILDPAFIQIIFHLNNLATTQIAVGDNLISSPFIEDIIRSNRMIKVVRNTSPREMYLSSEKLSWYIRDCITADYSSIWIAQRNGRTKDGIDSTEQGLLKMFDMSGSGNFAKDFDELNILPMSVSYQYEPCDFLKMRELFISKRRRYVKAPGEDTISIITGVKQNKGGVHIQLNKMISMEQLENISELNKNDRFKALAYALNESIVSSYKLWNTNYIAYDILDKSDRHREYYNGEEREAFIDYCNRGIDKMIKSDPELENNREELRDIFFSIYANPIHNKSN